MLIIKLKHFNTDRIKIGDHESMGPCNRCSRWPLQDRPLAGLYYPIPAWLSLTRSQNPWESELWRALCGPSLGTCSKISVIGFQCRLPCTSPTTVRNITRCLHHTAKFKQWREPWAGHLHWMFPVCNLLNKNWHWKLGGFGWMPSALQVWPFSLLTDTWLTSKFISKSQCLLRERQKSSDILEELRMQGIIKSQSTTARSGEAYENKVSVITWQEPLPQLWPCREHPEIQLLHTQSIQACLL